MKLSVTTRNYEMSDEDQRALDRLEDRLGRLVQHFDPDLVHVTLDLERHSRRDEYLGSGRLVLLNRALPARRNTAPTLAVLVKRIGEDLEDQVRRFRARLSRSYVYGRRRPALTSAEREIAERQMGADRELMDRAMQGNEGAWQELVELERPRLRGVIESELADCDQSGDETLPDEILAAVLEAGFRDLPRKPSRWSVFGWLTRMARQEVKRRTYEVPGTAVPAGR